MVWGLFYDLYGEIFFSLLGEICTSVVLRLSGALWVICEDGLLWKPRTLQAF